MTNKTTITLTEKDGVVTATFSGEEAKEHIELIRQHWSSVDLGLICTIKGENIATFHSNDREQPTNAQAVETILSTIGSKVGHQSESAAKLAVISKDTIVITP